MIVGILMALRLRKMLRRMPMVVKSIMPMVSVSMGSMPSSLMQKYARYSPRHRNKTGIEAFNI